MVYSMRRGVKKSPGRASLSSCDSQLAKLAEVQMVADTRLPTKSYVLRLMRIRDKQMLPSKIGDVERLHPEITKFALKRLAMPIIQGA